MKKRIKWANGFSMIELLFAAGLFTVIAGAVFSLLFNSQWRYQSESSLTAAFQQANIVMDQMVRDIHSAGYPPQISFTNGVSAQYYAVAFPWSPNYPSTPCSIGICASPGDYDLLLEADLGGGVQWIRYSLQGTTLMRGTTPKGSGDPLNISPAWNTLWTPYLENVVNQNSSPSQPIFRYLTASGQPASQSSDVREVNICLIVQSAKPDPKTGQFRTITLTGQAVAFNADR